MVNSRGWGIKASVLAISKPEALGAKDILQRKEKEWAKDLTELKKRVPPDGETAVELMFQGRGKLRIGHHRGAESAQREEIRAEKGAETVGRSRGESKRHHKNDAKREQPQEASGRGPGEARHKTSQTQENCSTGWQESYSVGPRIKCASATKRAGEGTYPESVAGPRNTGTRGKGSSGTGSRSKSACTPRQTGESTHQQSVADSGRPDRQRSTAAHTGGQRHRDSGRLGEGTVREGKSVDKRKASESTAPCQKSARI